MKKDYIFIAPNRLNEKGKLMSEIKSAPEVAEAYVAEIKSANDDLANDSASITEDYTTNLVVNTNSTELYELAKEATSLLSAQIAVDCGRLSSIALLFEEKDQALAGGR